MNLLWKSNILILSDNIILETTNFCENRKDLLGNCNRIIIHEVMDTIAHIAQYILIQNINIFKEIDVT
jgi:hypothetical protein